MWIQGHIVGQLEWRSHGKIVKRSRCGGGTELKASARAPVSRLQVPGLVRAESVAPLGFRSAARPSSVPFGPLDRWLVLVPSGGLGCRVLWCGAAGLASVPRVCLFLFFESLPRAPKSILPCSTDFEDNTSDDFNLMDEFPPCGPPFFSLPRNLQKDIPKGYQYVDKTVKKAMRKKRRFLSVQPGQARFAPHAPPNQ